jgi:MFS transporter, DHA3 family, macrolide efflux protein
MSGSNRAKKEIPAWPFPFFALWGTQTFALFGAGMVQFALIWWITSTTESALLVSIATSIVLLPRIILNPFIGALSDRWSRRIIMIAAGIVITACSLTLLLLSLRGVLATWQILVVLLFRSIADTFHSKAMISSTSMMVPAENLTRIAGINQALSGVIMFLTPASGAYLLKASSIATVVAIDLLVALAAITPLLFIAVPQAKSSRIAEDTISKESLSGDIREGLSFLRGWPGAIGMLLISASMNFIMQPYFSLLPIFVKNVLHGGEMEFGLVGAMSGLGFLIGGTAIGIWQGYKKRMVTSLIGIAGAGLALLWSGAMSNRGLLPCSIGFFAAGAMMPLCMGPIQSLIQHSVRNDMQARVFSIVECVSTCAAPLGLILAGTIFGHASPSYWYYGGGIAALSVALFGFLSDRVRNLGYVR